VTISKLSLKFFAFTLAAVLLKPVVATAQPSDEASIRALETRFAAAVVAKNVDAIMKTYAPDVFVFDLVPPRQYVGAAAYAEDWHDLFAGFSGPVHFEISDLAISTDGTIAYSHSIQRLSGADPSGGKVDITSRVTDIYRKVAGHWRIVQEHVSVPVDLATGKPDFTSKP
jgi:ketosteroid isomerase-like protein